MHIETSADARRSRRHDAGGGLAGPAADDRGYLAAAASRLSLWWRGTSRTPALTADTASGAGLQGGDEGSVRLPNGDAISAPSADSNTRTQPILLISTNIAIQLYSDHSLVTKIVASTVAGTWYCTVACSG
eukprot:COSAG05_NODE_1343_length_5135_cov_4.082208_7_plen_131_part_00